MVTLLGLLHNIITRNRCSKEHSFCSTVSTVVNVMEVGLFLMNEDSLSLRMSSLWRLWLPFKLLQVLICFIGSFIISNGHSLNNIRSIAFLGHGNSILMNQRILKHLLIGGNISLNLYLFAILMCGLAMLLMSYFGHTFMISSSHGCTSQIRFLIYFLFLCRFYFV